MTAVHPVGDVPEEPLLDSGTVALIAASLFHGIASLNQHSKPPRVETVLGTADEFLEFMDYARSNGKRGRYPRR